MIVGYVWSYRFSLEMKLQHIQKSDKWKFNNTFPSTCIPVKCIFADIPNPNRFVIFAANIASMSSAVRKFNPNSKTLKQSKPHDLGTLLFATRQTFQETLSTYQMVVTSGLTTNPHFCNHWWRSSHIQTLNHSFFLNK